MARTLLFVLTVAGAFAADPPRFQYQAPGISVPAATADEPVRKTVSIPDALRYLEAGALAWAHERKCISCHSNGTYMLVAPQLASRLGAPSTEVYSFFRQVLGEFRTADRSLFFKETGAQQLIYLAAGLAEWDANVTGKLSQETEQALRLMLRTQVDSGGWTSMDCWPPLESSPFHAATMAARATAVAPGWLDKLKDGEMVMLLNRLRSYLGSGRPQHDYDRVSLLWTSAKMKGLLTGEKKKALMDLIVRRQRADGGWSLRSFAKPEEWGSGNRAAKLRAESEFADPPSDGHMTGLALVALRENGISANDPRIRRGIAWILRNQRQSGRWWTRSLNTDSRHLISYSGTAYPLLALVLCDAVPPSPAGGSKRVK